MMRSTARVWPFQLAMAIGLGVNLAYLVYRATASLHWSGPWAVFVSWLLYLAELHCFLSLALFYLQIWHPHAPEPPEPEPGLGVDVLVPTYNEDIELLRATLSACAAMTYPHRTWVLDDGHRTEVRALAQELGIDYLSRTQTKGAKGGNLNDALLQTRGEYLAVFDADHVPEPSFLVRVLGYFQDPRVAMVQTPHVFYNLDSFQIDVDFARRRKWDEQEVFFRLIQPGRHHWNAVAFAGSGAVFRREALTDIGGFATETITEDLHTSLRLHARGWKAVYHNERLLSGLASKDVRDYQGQRLRWAEGNLGILLVDNPLWTRGLTLVQRLVYFGAIFHWTTGFPKLVFVLTPILTLFTGVSALANFDATMAVAVVANLAAILTSVKVAGRGTIRIITGDLFAMASFWLFIWAALRAFVRWEPASFVVTPKRGQRTSGIPAEIRPHLLIIAVSLMALTWGSMSLAFGLSTDIGGMVAGLFWGGLNLLFALGVVRRSLAFTNQRYAYRFPAFLVSRYSGGRGQVSDYGISTDVSELGMSLTTPRPLERGSRVELSLMGPGRCLSCQGEVRWSIERSRGGVRSFRHGIRFVELTQAEVDGLSRLWRELAIPRMFAHFEEAPTLAQWLRAFLARPGRFRWRARRYPLRLPVVVQPAGPGQAWEYPVTEDLSETGVQILLSMPRSAQSTLSLGLLTPLGEVRVRARVARVETVSVGGQHLYRHGLAFGDLPAATAQVLRALLARRGVRVPPELRGLQGDRLPTPERQRALVPIVAVVSAMIVMAVGVFRGHNDPSIALRELARLGSGPPEAAAVLALHGAIGRQARPRLTDLEILTDLLMRIDRPLEAATLIARIVDRHPEDPGYRLRLGDTLGRIGRHAEAREQYARLESQLTPATALAFRRTCLLASARNLVRLGRHGEASDRLLAAVRLEPRDTVVLGEAAGVLVLAGRLQEARARYRALLAMEPANLDVAYALIALEVMDGRYASAEAACRMVLASGRDEVRARRVLADILTWRRDYGQARVEVARLARAGGSTSPLGLRLATLALWQRDYDRALEGFQEQMGDPDRVGHLWPLYIDAAAGATRLAEPQRRTALALADRSMAPSMSRPPLLARLAWVLTRMGEGPRAVGLLERALALAPSDRSIRLQLADALHAIGAYDRAEDHYRILVDSAARTGPH